MDYLITTVYSERDYLEAPRYFLVRVKDVFVRRAEDLIEETNRLQGEDLSILGVRAWSPVNTLWVTGRTGGFTGALEQPADDHEIVSFSEEELEELEFADVDVQTLHTRRGHGDSDAEVYAVGNHRHIRVESRSFTLSDLKQPA